MDALATQIQANLKSATESAAKPVTPKTVRAELDFKASLRLEEEVDLSPLFHVE